MHTHVAFSPGHHENPHYVSRCRRRSLLGAFRLIHCPCRWQSRTAQHTHTYLCDTGVRWRHRDQCQPSALAGLSSPPKQRCGTNQFSLVLREGDLLKDANSLTTLPRWQEALSGRFPREKCLRRSSGPDHLEKSGKDPFVLFHMMEVHFYQQLKCIFICFLNKHTQSLSLVSTPLYFLCSQSIHIL